VTSVTAAPPLREREPGTRPAGEFAGIKMAEVELCQPLQPISDDGRYRRAWVLVRLSTEPIGARIIDMDAGGLSPDRLGEVLWPELGDAVGRRFEAAGLPAPSGLGRGGLDPVHENWPFLQARAEALRSAPYISVVICTYNRPDRLKVCLRHVQRQQYPAFEVIVVDNCPEAGEVRAQVASFGDPTYRYVAEPRVGLSRARNTGVAAASGDIVAFLDDDEEPNDYWLAALAAGFARSRDIGCVTGLILPARLDTEAQALFEELGGHSKGRGFEPAVFAADGPQSPLYPRPPFGAGGNMAIRRETLAKIGRFDTALGAGTPARGAEDTLALTLVMLAGDKIAYEPAAFVRHHHYPDFAGLATQQQGYTVGLTAYYAALIRRRPSVLIGLVRLLPAALRYLVAPRVSAAPRPTGLPPELASGRIRGLLKGPVAYLRGIIRNASPGPRHA
jgi:O-antigen biosynthesis protein